MCVCVDMYTFSLIQTSSEFGKLCLHLFSRSSYRLLAETFQHRAQELIEDVKAVIVKECLRGRR